MINWLKFKKFYLGLSFVLIILSAISLFKYNLRLGVDFTGGSNVEYSFEEEISTENLSEYLENSGFDVSAIQKTSEGTYLLRLAPLDEEKKSELTEKIEEKYEGGFEELQFASVGPSVGPELVKKTLYAIGIASSVILLWVAYQFRSLKFGAAAILAMFHDTFVLIGAFAILGKYYGAEVDFLFVTAVLTTLSFSVHDTIVVFDRIREITKNDPMDDLISTSNRALTETMVRSLNNSFTIIFMLLALLLLGGTTVRWFAASLMIGTILGTYSSPFVAVPLLVIFDKMKGERE